MSLSEQFADDWESYTCAKGPFIAEVVKKALG